MMWRVTIFGRCAVNGILISFMIQKKFGEIKNSVFGYNEGIDKRVCCACHVRVHDVFDMKCAVSAYVHVFRHACFNVSKNKKLKHTCLARRVKCVRV
jgi:hypothetical protein